MASGRLILPIDEPIFSSSGLLVSGATLTVYITGTQTLASLYADQGLTTPITNPQTSDAAGRFYAQTTVIWGDATQGYDCVIDWPDGTSETYDAIFLLGAATSTTGFAPINSPIFTGDPQAPTTALNDNSNSLATTGYVQGQDYAPLNSPALTGVPTAPTASLGTDTTQLATTAFVTTAIGLTNPTNATAGYVKFLGIILQWQTFSLGSAGGATQAVTWPIAFISNVIGVPWIACNGAALEMIGVTSATTTGCTVVKGISDTFARTGVVWALGN